LARDHHRDRDLAALGIRPSDDGGVRDERVRGQQRLELGRRDLVSGAVAWRERFGDLREALRIALDRIARRDRLASGWTVDAATDWALTRLQPSTRRHLIDERGWTPEEYTERTVRSLLHELVAVPR